ncbi:hypothetical protein [Streptomyces sp. NBC_01180]|uniref:hypothetical protein n=1 Tax=unclassified Streptomyces TaxID=2593676 RepID=UPI00386B5079
MKVMRHADGAAPRFGSRRPYRIVGSKGLWASAEGRGPVPVPVAHMPSKVSRR